ncbi:MarR family transcriptional regulator [Roseibium aquae]|uniref:MarR family transcriptional regulator n=1 Tax=Roseibium aquae TaxID=1323746 RepID=A0A916TG71_9HYPH|nr:MarR family transcriptional regulator [Roseibium aquae]GGB43869.1 MarR family transcriptional regulator [Roseibium aquae]
MPDTDLPLYFRLFNEIGIVDQLGRARFEKRLPQGVTVSHFSVLNHLMRVEDGRTPLELARAFQVPKTTVSHWLTGLDTLGFVNLRPNPNDRRSKQVWLTEAGRAFRDKAIADLAPDLARVKDVMDPDEVADLVARLERLRIWLDTNR